MTTTEQAAPAKRAPRKIERPKVRPGADGKIPAVVMEWSGKLIVRTRVEYPCPEVLMIRAEATLPLFYEDGARFVHPVPRHFRLQYITPAGHALYRP